jgi:hypothetical protein
MVCVRQGRPRYSFGLLPRSQPFLIVESHDISLCFVVQQRGTRTQLCAALQKKMFNRDNRIIVRFKKFGKKISSIFSFCER